MNTNTNVIIASKKKFKESDIKDLRGPWHTKDWTCPHCKHQNVTLKSYDY